MGRTSKTGPPHDPHPRSHVGPPVSQPDWCTPPPLTGGEPCTELKMRGSAPTLPQGQSRSSTGTSRHKQQQQAALVSVFVLSALEAAEAPNSALLQRSTPAPLPPPSPRRCAGIPITLHPQRCLLITLPSPSSFFIHFHDMFWLISWRNYWRFSNQRPVCDWGGAFLVGLEAGGRGQPNWDNTE